MASARGSRRPRSCNLPTVPGILSVSPDSSGRLLGTYDPTTDTGSLTTTAQRVGADDAWSAGYTGKGVDIALIDSGVSPVNGLTTPGKIINGPDFSLESGVVEPPLPRHLRTRHPYRRDHRRTRQRRHRPVRG